MLRNFLFSEPEFVTFSGAQESIPSLACRYDNPNWRTGLPRYIAVLGIRDILVLDPYLWIMDPDPTPDPTSFFIGFKDAKKYLFCIFFLLHHLQSKKSIFLLKFCVKILFCRHYFFPLNTSMRKGKYPEPDLDQEPNPDTYIWQINPDPDPGGPKTCGSCHTAT